MPLCLAKGAIERVPLLARLTRVPAEAVDYLAHPTVYATANATRDLARTGCVVPPFAAYAARLVGYAYAHPLGGSTAIA